MGRLLLAIVLAAASLLGDAARAEGLLIIANPSVTASAPIGTSQIAAIYLLRVTVWPDGSHIVPVNREAASDTRAAFTAAVLKQDNASLAAYWNEMHFKGASPPIIQESEQAMLAFIQKVPGAIGYIRDTTAPGDVKVLGHVP